MKRLILCLFMVQTGIFVCTANNLADSTAVERAKIFADMEEDVVVISDPAIDRVLLDKINDIHREQVTIQGYRVQVFSSNRQKTAKAEAYKMEKLVKESSMETSIYVLYNPPFFKVRLGDCRTMEEAQALMEEVVRVLPQLQAETYIVRDKIQVIQ